MELKGVPVRLEIGRRTSQQAMLSWSEGTRREETGQDGGCKKEIEEMLKEIHKNLYEKAKKFLHDNTHKANDYPELKKIVKEKGAYTGAVVRIGGV